MLHFSYARQYPHLNGFRFHQFNLNKPSTILWYPIIFSVYSLKINQEMTCEYWTGLCHFLFKQNSLKHWLTLILETKKELKTKLGFSITYSLCFILNVLLILCTHIKETINFVYFLYKNTITYTPNHILTNRKINCWIKLINFALHGKSKTTLIL